jgi:NADPH2:quinone reductase
MFEERRLTPVLYSKIYTLDTVVDGLRELEERKTWGKVVMRVRDPPATASAKL